MYTSIKGSAAKLQTFQVWICTEAQWLAVDPAVGTAERDADVQAVHTANETAYYYAEYAADRATLSTTDCTAEVGPSTQPTSVGNLDE
jgi:hypothetical protein